MRFAVMAIDPGRATGVARGMFWADTRVDKSWGTPGERVAPGEDDGVQIWLVIESFALRQVNVDLTGVEVAAGLRALLVPRQAGLEGRLSLPVGGAGADGMYALGTRVVEQSPGDAKGFATDKRLKEWGLYPLSLGPRLGKGDHRRDALRHLALRVARVLHSDEEWGRGLKGSFRLGEVQLVGDCLRTYGPGTGSQMEAWVVEGDPRIQAWELAAEFKDWVGSIRAPLVRDGGKLG